MDTPTGPIPVCVSCGTRGKPGAMRCPECDALFPLPGSPMLRQGHPVPPAKKPADVTNPYEIPVPKLAWEVYVILLVLALSVIGSLIQGSWFTLGVSSIMFVGLFKREEWGWWMTFILAMLEMGLCFLLLFFMMGVQGGEALRTFLYVVVACDLVILILLIVCRVRGAYFPNTDYR
jgi:hypothetical protein